MTTAYETDFYQWTQQQAALLRQGHFSELDTAHLIDEIEDMGGSKERELESRLGHCLKVKDFEKLSSPFWIRN